MRIIFLLFIGFLSFTTVRGQEPIGKKTMAPDTAKQDTGYVNKGRIAGRKAIRRSLILPGLGQAYNYGLVVDDVKSGVYQDKRVLQKIYIVGKIGLIYGGGAVLVSSYIDNHKKYRAALAELQWRQAHPNDPPRDNEFVRYETQYLNEGKAIYKNNREVVLISLFVLYGANVVDAYVTARLKYHNVENELSYKISPTLINGSPMYGFKPLPGLKLSIRL